MARLTGLTLVWLRRGTLSNMAWTIMIHFLRWPSLLMFACFSLWLLNSHGPFFGWISRMPSVKKYKKKMLSLLID